MIADSRETIRKTAASPLDGWLTPAITNDETTQHVLAEEGIKYTLDMVHDDQPMPVKVRNGRLISVPYSLEVNDVPLFQLATRRSSATPRSSRRSSTSSTPRARRAAR